MAAKARPLIPYMRKSSGEDEKGSLARQRQAIRSWAKRNNVTLAAEVWEPGVSGSKSWRQRALGQAIAACERGEAGGIIVEEQSRLSRENGLATAEVWAELERLDLRLVCASEGLDTANGDCELSFAIKAAIAREQWKQYKRRSEATKKHAVEVLGIHIGPPPIGYTRAKQSHEPLRRDPKLWKVVRAAFCLRATGAGLHDVMRFLDRKAPGGPSGHGAWAVSTVTRMLANRVYLGEARGGSGYVKPGAHPAIVDQETFDACQALSRRREPVPVEAKSLLAGVARCAGCGHALQRQRVGRVAGRYYVYRCRRRSAAGECPASASVMVPALDRLVEAAIKERLADQTIERVATGKDVDAIHERLAKARKKREPFEDPDYVALLGLAAASRALSRVDKTIAQVEAELAAALTNDNGFVGVVDRRAALDALVSLDVTDRRGVVQAMLDGVFVAKAPRGTAVGDRVRLVWRGEPLPIARPARGRPARTEVETRVAAA
jgi:DNA invertase Pin-like site-specific DNA recombinase